MDPNITELLRRQAEWQKGLKDRPWPEKIRIAEQMRDAMIALRGAPLVDAAAQSDQSVVVPPTCSRLPLDDTPVE